MAGTGVVRKLTAILAADVVGYSRLMGADEEGTVAALSTCRDVFRERIAALRGQVVDAKGDAILAEFPSVVDAVACAVAIQQELSERNAELPEERRMAFRIGVNLGDVIVREDAIYGDGVNIAARLESLAEPGGVCISGSAHEQVRNKLALGFEDLGEQAVKNIAEPVRAHLVRMEPRAAGDPQGAAPGASPRQPATASGSAAPRLAVLPFKNMSGEPDQEYFSDGISEDLMTDLSKISQLSVTSQHSAFTFKGRDVNMRQVGRELGVRYVLEGSVRKAGNRVRITAQLIDAENDRHLWSERFDRELEDIFAVQDEITREIVTALQVRLVEGEKARVWRKPTTNPQAYDLFLRARDLGAKLSRDTVAVAMRLCQQAVTLDPNFALPYIEMAIIHNSEARYGWSENSEESLERSFEMAERALTLDDSLAMPHTVIGLCHLGKRQFERAIAEGEKAVSKAPYHSDSYAHLGRIQLFAGEPQRALESVRRAMAVVPIHPPWLGIILGGIFVTLERFSEALQALQLPREQMPDSPWTHVYLAAAYAGLERMEEAEREVREINRIEPGLRLDEWGHRALPFRYPADLERMLGLLRKAGLK